MNWQEWFATAMVAFAVLALVRRWFKSSDGNGCAGCGGASTSTNARRAHRRQIVTPEQLRSKHGQESND